MLFPVGKDEISRAVTSRTELSWRNDGRPVVRYGLLMMGSQGKQAEWYELAAQHWDDCKPDGNLRDLRMLLGWACVHLCFAILTQGHQNIASHLKDASFWSCVLHCCIFLLWRNKVTSKKASVKREQSNVEYNLLLWNRIKRIFLLKRWVSINKRLYREPRQARLGDHGSAKYLAVHELFLTRETRSPSQY